MPKGKGAAAKPKDQPKRSSPEHSTEAPKTGHTNEPSGEHNISMSELLDIIETKAKEMFEGEIEKLISEVKSLNEQVEELSRDRDAQKTQNDKLWFEINKRAQENQELKMKLDAFEQDTKSNNVRVDGDKDIKTNIETMANENLNIEDIDDSDVVCTWRLGRDSGKKPRDLIITFSTREKRDEFYMQCKKTKVKLEDGSPLYVNEDLTTLRSKLFYDARRLVKAAKLHSAWTWWGNIMVKTTDDSKPRPIYNHDDLRSLLYEAIRSSDNSEFDFDD